jgi:hypothetical protein
MTVTEKVSLKVTATIVDPISIANLPTLLAVSLPYSSPLTSETLNLVIYGKSTVSLAQEKSMA